jgi:hypothetical protein
MAVYSTWWGAVAILYSARGPSGPLTFCTALHSAWPAACGRCIISRGELACAAPVRAHGDNRFAAPQCIYTICAEISSKGQAGLSTVPQLEVPGLACKGKGEVARGLPAQQALRQALLGGQAHASQAAAWMAAPPRRARLLCWLLHRTQHHSPASRLQAAQGPGGLLCSCTSLATENGRGWLARLALYRGLDSLDYNWSGVHLPTFIRTGASSAARHTGAHLEHG